MVNKTLTTALEEVAAATPMEDLEELYPEPPVLVISVGYPPELWDNSKSYLKDLKSKLVIKTKSASMQRSRGGGKGCVEFLESTLTCT